MSLKTMQDFFSNFCVSDSNYIYIYTTYEQAENKLNDILTKNPDDKTSVSIFNVCKFMTHEQQNKICKQKADKFYRFFH
jgi:hypothetical protein